MRLLSARLLAAVAVSLAACQPPAPPSPPPAGSARPAPPPLEVPEARPVARKAAEPPLSLTASDGSGLRLVSMTARAVVEAPLAFTELRLVFDNPEPRVREGTFRIALPQGAAVSRFAMQIDGRWQEGEVVEKQKARQVYEDFLHRRQDPALLEQAAGNEFSARVFPIPARGRKELVVAYSHELPSGKAYQLPLAGLGGVEQLDVVAYAGGKPVLGLQKSAYVPEGDFEVPPSADAPRAVRAGGLALLRVRPVAEARPDRLAGALVLVDTSASRALGFEAELALLEQLVARLVASAGPKAPLQVAAFDQSVEPLFDGEAGSFGPGEIAKLRERGALGASDLGAALGWAFDRAKARGAKRVVLLGDGVATAGETDEPALEKAASRLAEAGVERLDAVAVGGIRDDALLARLSSAKLPRAGVVADGSKGADSAWNRLSQATQAATFAVEGARWQWPTRLASAQPGDEVLVYAELAEGAPLRVSIDGKPAEAASARTVELPLLERSWAKAKIDALSQAMPAGEAAARQKAEIVALSTRYRVLSPFTSLLVLETEADYERYAIDRRSLGDILTVQNGALAVLDRAARAEIAESPPASPPPAAKGPSGDDDKAHDKGKRDEGEEAKKEEPRPSEPPATAAEPPPQPGAHAAAEAPPPPPPPPPSPEPAAEQPARPSPRAPAADGPSTGLSGGMAGGIAGGVSGGVAGGTPGGSLSGASVAGPSGEVRAPGASVSGRASSSDIQREVRRRLPAVRNCYNRGLAQNPDLSGQVRVRFVIDEKGKVEQASSDGSTLPSQSVIQCILSVFRRIEFAAPESGKVTVLMPLNFARAGDAPPSRPGAPSGPVLMAAEKPAVADPYEGRFGKVMGLLASGNTQAALAESRAWRAKDAGDVMALVALGEAAEASRDATTAARAYGSIIDLFPGRADLRRMAGERLDRLATDASRSLSVDTYQKAYEQRPDHPSSHRLYAYALAKKGDLGRAFEVLREAATRPFRLDRFPGADRILREDLALVGAAWAKAAPSRRREIDEALRAAQAKAESGPSLRFVLTWETDANDVDFHIYDDRGGHAFFSQRSLPDGGGDLYADVTQGYGPECFTIRKPKAARAGAYTLQANYYSRGPMGYGMGKLEVVEHDGRGNLTFDERPFVVMKDHAFVDLGTIKGKGP